MKQFHRKHGLSQTHRPLWNSWMMMRRRCLFPNYNKYHNYGGRGIKVCEYLQASPANLMELIGDRPIGRTLDRINNKLHYSCGCCAECIDNGWDLNIRWATNREQGLNKRNSMSVTIDNVTLHVSQWAEIAGLETRLVYVRVRKGWTGKRLLSPPKKCGNHRKLVPTIPKFMHNAAYL